MQPNEGWDGLRQRTWTCACCGQRHQGIFGLAAAAPVHWEGSPNPLPNSAIGGSTHCLTEDFCIIGGQHTFIRCVLELPLADAPDNAHFDFGVWASLSRSNFSAYVDSFDQGRQGELGPWFGWFSCRLAGYPDTVNLKCRVHPRNRRDRPWIALEPSCEHPLAQESRQGIPYERLLEIYAANGHAPAADAPPSAPDTAPQ